ncbi:hypothetical protein RW25_19880 [Bacillus sp. L_1B0_8]|uniref:hypothetical protein n=1 Tax=unclassified Bacillus (in: firmicutes) TaxID=185979 RepID=UPI0005B716BE|nr:MULTISPECIES: hypothetical protein [unclassified Bacillus (in: firmicutes)]KIQ76996.1 hypothetical protein RT27_31670 [Bacillus sp. L_1B0_5]KIQ85402.1 hypothetical protein RW25_19880 [Bacillus sp. L_1B0_8]
MKKKRIFPVLLSLGLAFGVGVTTLALPSTNASAEVMEDQPTITLRDGNRSVVNKDFYISPGYGHVKMYLYNKGKSTVTIYLNHSSGKNYINKVELAPGQRYDWKSNDFYPQGVRAGNYMLQLTSGDEPTIVDFAYKTSDNPW